MCCLLLESKSLSRSQIFSVSLTIWELKNWRAILGLKKCDFSLSEIFSVSNSLRIEELKKLKKNCWIEELLWFFFGAWDSSANKCEELDVCMCVHAGDHNRQGAWCQEATCSRCGDLPPDKHLLPPWGKQNAHTRTCTIVHQLAPRILFLLLLGLELGFMLGLEIFCTRMCKNLAEKKEACVIFFEILFIYFCDSWVLDDDHDDG